MKRHLFLKILLPFLCGTLAHAAPAYTPEPGSKSEKSEVKTGAWDITPNPKLPNVLILGDSISIGYTQQVRAELKGKANVFRATANKGKNAENCEGTRKGVKNIDRWLKGQKWDLIHFNWGLHDLKHVSPKNPNKNSNSPNDPRQAEPDLYQKNLTEIVAKLKKTDAKLIFATTTAYPKGTKPERRPEDAVTYNEIARKIMTANDIAINDLHAFTSTRLKELQLPKNVHFNVKGNAALAKQVVTAIQVALSAAK